MYRCVVSELDHVHDIDPDALLDLTGDELVDAWRGVKAEDADDTAGGLASLLRSRSRALLNVLARPVSKVTRPAKDGV